MYTFTKYTKYTRSSPGGLPQAEDTPSPMLSSAHRAICSPDSATRPAPHAGGWRADETALGSIEARSASRAAGG